MRCDAGRMSRTLVAVESPKLILGNSMLAAIPSTACPDEGGRLASALRLTRLVCGSLDAYGEAPLHRLAGVGRRPLHSPSSSLHRLTLPISGGSQRSPTRESVLSRRGLKTSSVSTSCRVLHRDTDYGASIADGDKFCVSRLYGRTQNAMAPAKLSASTCL